MSLGRMIARLRTSFGMCTIAYASVCFKSSTSLIVDSSSSGPRDITGMALPNSKAVYSTADCSMDCFLSLGTPSLLRARGSYLSSGLSSVALSPESDALSSYLTSSSISSNKPLPSSPPILAAVFFFYFFAASAFFLSSSFVDFFFDPPRAGSPSIFKS
mgnify:CR=1 FL=1